MKYLIYIFLFILCINRVHGQEPYAVVYNTENGLPSNTIYQIFQDSKGFIWIASDEGLCRYDGLEYKSYSMNNQSSKAGSEIHEDLKGRIWYENFDGYIFYVEHDTLKTLNNQYPLGYQNYAIIKNHLFLIQKSGVQIIDLDDFKILKTISINIDNLSTTQQIQSHFYIHSSDLLELDYNGHIKTFTMKQYSPELLPGLMMRQADEILLNSKRHSEVGCIQIKNNKFQLKFQLNFMNYIQTSVYTKNIYWYCTTNGAYAYDSVGKSIGKNQPIFKNKNISGVMQDRDGNYWFSTLNEGILLVPNLHTLVYKNIKLPNRISSGNNKLYIGTQKDEIYTTDKNLNTVELIKKGNSNHEIYLINYDSINQNLLYTSENFNILNQGYQSILSTQMSIKDIKYLSENVYAVAGSGFSGLIILNNQNHEPWKNYPIIRYKNYSAINLLSGLRGKSVVYIQENKTILFATNIGLYSITPSTKKEILFQNKKIIFSQLVNHSKEIYGIDDQGMLYTIENNTIKLHPLYNSTNELQNLRIKQLKIFNNKLYLRTNKGIYQIDQIKNATVFIIFVSSRIKT